MKKLLVLMITFLAFAAIAQTVAPVASTPSISTILAAVLGALFAISEALSLIPGVESNGVFQLIFNTLKSLVSKSPTP